MTETPEPEKNERPEVAKAKVETAPNKVRTKIPAIPEAKRVIASASKLEADEPDPERSSRNFKS